MSDYYVDEVDGVFFTDRTAATEQEFRDRIAAFESAPTPPEVREAAVLEEVARAMADEDLPGFPFTALADDELARYRRLAAAAVAAYRATQDGGAEEAVRRVEALAEVLTQPLRPAGEWGEGYDNAREDVAKQIRTALAPQADR